MREGQDIAHWKIEIKAKLILPGDMANQSMMIIYL